MTALLCVLVEKDGFQNKYISKRLLSLPLPYQRTKHWNKNLCNDTSVRYKI